MYHTYILILLSNFLNQIYLIYFVKCIFIVESKKEKENNKGDSLFSLGRHKYKL